MSNGQQACETCRYYEPESVIKGGKPGQGICRRNPPSVVGVVTQQGLVSMCNFPTVKKEAWCGEHKPQPDE